MTETNERLLRRPEVSALTGLPKSSLYAAFRKGEFPAPIRLTKRTVAWRESEIRAFIDRKTKERDAA